MLKCPHETEQEQEEELKRTSEIFPKLRSRMVLLRTRGQIRRLKPENTVKPLSTEKLLPRGH